MTAPRKPVSRLANLVLTAGLGVAALAAAQPASAQVMTYFGWGSSPAQWYRDDPQPRSFYRSYSSRQIADHLYRYYGAQHVLLVRPAGDVFEADIIDRRGYRVRYTLARDTAEVLDRYTLGGERYRSAAPVPPGFVPDRMLPDEPRAVPRSSPPREARGAPAERPAPARPQVQESPSVPAPSVGPVERRPLPEPPVAATPPEAARPEVARPAPAPKETPRMTAPTPPAAAAPAQRPAASAESRAIQPPPRIPEPLTDPKTGRANPAATPAPVTPLDDTARRGAAAAPVPPAVLE